MMLLKYSIHIIIVNIYIGNIALTVHDIRTRKRVVEIAT